MHCALEIVKNTLLTIVGILLSTNLRTNEVQSEDIKGDKLMSKKQ